jgi:hypothetical protein
MILKESERAKGTHGLESGQEGQVRDSKRK